MTQSHIVSGVTQPPSEVGPCPPSRYGIPPNFTTPSDVAWANAILSDPNSSAPNRARAQQLLAGPMAPT
jgi:hypothetical protein